LRGRDRRHSAVEFDIRTLNPCRPTAIDASLVDGDAPRQAVHFFAGKGVEARFKRISKMRKYNRRMTSKHFSAHVIAVDCILSIDVIFITNLLPAITYQREMFRNRLRKAA